MRLVAAACVTTGEEQRRMKREAVGESNHWREDGGEVVDVMAGHRGGDVTTSTTSPPSSRP